MAASAGSKSLCQGHCCFKVSFASNTKSFDGDRQNSFHWKRKENLVQSKISVMKGSLLNQVQTCTGREQDTAVVNKLDIKNGSLSENVNKFC